MLEGIKSRHFPGGLGLLAAVLWLMSAPATTEAAVSSLYVADGASAGPGSLHQFTLSAPRGAPIATGSPPASTGDNPQHPALTSNGRFAYATAAGNGLLYAYRVRRADGVLVPLKSKPSVPAGIGAHGVSVTPNGRSAYVASQETGSVSQYSIRRGVPSPMNPPAITSGPGASGVAISPDGRSVYVTNLNGGTVSQFSANPRTGKLTPKSRPTMRTPPAPSGLAVNPNGRSLYVATLSGHLAQFDIKPGNGTLRRKRPATVAVGIGASGVAITPRGTHLYTPNSIADTVSQYSIDRKSGRLTALKPASVRVGDRPEGVAMAADGRSIYTTASADNAIQWLSIRRDGRLAGIGRKPLAAGSGPHGLIAAPNQGPRARLKVRRRGGPLRAHRWMRLDASASRDRDGRIARYRWHLGDGRSVVTTRPKVVHRYRQPGLYRLRLVVTDDGNCSARRLYTGQTTSCNGGRRAIVKRWIRVPPNR